MYIVSQEMAHSWTAVPWRLGQNSPPKCRQLAASGQGVAVQKTWTFHQHCFGNCSSIKCVIYWNGLFNCRVYTKHCGILNGDSEDVCGRAGTKRHTSERLFSSGSADKQSQWTVSSRVLEAGIPATTSRRITVRQQNKTNCALCWRRWMDAWWQG
jgi:hypothetical protein